MKNKNCNSFSVDGGIPRKMDGTLLIMRYAHDTVYRPFFFGVYLHPPKKLLQSFLKNLVTDI